MIRGIYATLGVFLLVAAQNPFAHTSLIWFVVWSSIVHVGIMAVQDSLGAARRGHLLGGVPALEGDRARRPPQPARGWDVGFDGRVATILCRVRSRGWLTG